MNMNIMKLKKHIQNKFTHHKHRLKPWIISNNPNKSLFLIILNKSYGNIPEPIEKNLILSNDIEYGLDFYWKV